MVIKTDKHEYWLGHDAHALIAHVRLAGKAFQLSLGIALEDISGTGRDCTGARTPADVIILALARRAGWEVQRTDGALGEGDTPNAKAAAGAREPARRRPLAAVQLQVTVGLHGL